MAWFFRVIEQEDGGWACRHGLTEYDIHDVLEHALEHITALASKERPATIFLHRLNGLVEVVGEA